jgi:tryptophan synthase alpha chain
VKTVDDVFGNLRSNNRRALIPFLTAGYPDVPTFMSLVREASARGADLIEVGIPFSDPIADGPMIQHSSARSLDNGVTLAKAIEMTGELAATTSTPFLVMSYLNPILRIGVDRFVRSSVKAGIVGVIVPDLPVEEAGLFKNVGPGARPCARPSISSFLAPTSSEKRTTQVCAQAEGFIYLVSVTGVTGAKNGLPTEVPALVERVRRHTKLPVCAGFGISNPRQARYLSGLVDGVIVGSAIIEIIRDEGEKAGAVRSVGNFLAAMRAALDTKQEDTRSN